MKKQTTIIGLALASILMLGGCTNDAVKSTEVKPKNKDVKDAIYVVGTERKGTMSGLSKYAFKGPMSARRFSYKK